MSLEFRQLLNNELLAGAAVLGAGRTLGFSDDETIQAKRATQRREQRRRREQRAEREGNRAAAEAFLAEDDAKFKQKARMTESELSQLLNSNVRSDIDDEAWAFGEDPVWIRDDKGALTEKKPRRPQDDDQYGSEFGKPEIRAARVDSGAVPRENLSDTELDRLNEGRTRPQTGIGGMRDALSRLEMAKEQYGFAAFGAEGAEMERLYYSLKSELGDRQQKDRERREASLLASSDAKRRRGEVSDAAIYDAVNRTVRNADFGKNEVIIGDKRSPRKQLEEKLLAEALGKRDWAAAGGPEFRQMKNETKAALEAQEIANRNGGLRRQLADADIGNIAEVRSLGGAGHASHDPNYKAAGNYQVIRSVDPSTFGTAIPLTDKDGQIREYYGYEGRNLVQLGEVNVDSTDQALNAPKPTPGQSWVSQYLPTYGKPGGTTFGYPQVGINEEMALLGDRIRGMGYGFDGIGNPRSLADFEKAMGAIVGRGQSTGDTFWRFDPEARKTVAVGAPGVDDVLYKLGYTENEKSRLANALFQSQAAKVVDVNQGDKSAYFGRTERPGRTGFTESVNLQTGETRSPFRDDVNMDVAELRPDRGTALDKIKNEKVGRGKKQKGVRAELAAIDGNRVVEALAARNELMVTTPSGQQVLSPEAARAIQGAKEARGDAQMPLYGNIAGEQVDKARFIRGTDRGTGLTALVDRYGAKQGEVASEVERRYLEDKRLRGEAAGRTTDPIAAEQRRRDAEIAAKSAQMSYDDEIREKQELIKLIKKGATQDAGFDLGGTVDGKPRVIPAAQKGRKLQVPEFGAKPFTIGGDRSRFLESVQPTRTAPVASSIAPDPGASTGNQAAPMADAGMGGGQQPPKRPVATGGPMPEDMRNQLFSLPGPYQSAPTSRPAGPAPRTGDRTDAQRKDRLLNILTKTTGLNVRDIPGEFNKFRKTGKGSVNRFGRNAAAAGGAAVVLDTILNMGNNKEEEEQLR